jgi:hypothetical protein
MADDDAARAGFQDPALRITQEPGRRPGLPSPAATRQWLRLCLTAACLAAACSQPAPSSPQIRLDAANAAQPIIEVAGVARRDLAALSGANLTGDEWSALLRVTVKPSGSTPASAGAPLPVAGRYAVAESVRFTPLFPLDAGREYEVVFDPSRLPPRTTVAAMPSARAVVALPAVARVPSTTVDAVYPSGEEIPENLLRMYVHFSAPMGQQGGLDHVVLLDQAGHEIADAVLPLDAELWNADRTRYTVIFDPGRVKREILPNRRMGRPLHAGQMITLVVKADWLDANAAPLKAEFRRAYRVVAADERPLDPATWRVTAPPAGTRESLAVTFPEPLDRGLLERALGVESYGVRVAGELNIGDGEMRWMFTPRDPWQAGAYALAILPILEDLAGNRIGRAFEVLSPGDAVPEEGSQPIRLPFQVGVRK